MSTLIFFFEIPADLLISVIAYLINLSTERLAEQQIIECMARLECTCCFQFWNKIPTLEPKTHKKKISFVFDEGLQRKYYN